MKDKFKSKKKRTPESIISIKKVLPSNYRSNNVSIESKNNLALDKLDHKNRANNYLMFLSIFIKKMPS